MFWLNCERTSTRWSLGSALLLAQVSIAVPSCCTSDYTLLLFDDVPYQGITLATNTSAALLLAQILATI